MRLRSQAAARSATPTRRDDADTPIITDQVGARLVEAGDLSADDLERIAAHQARTGTSFTDAAVDLGLISPEAVARALAVQAQSGLVDADDGRVSPAVVAAFDPLDPLALKLRELRSTLFAPAEMRRNEARVLVLAGVGTDETPGIAANFAVLVAQLGFRGLLVDANFASPAHHNLFGVGSAEDGVTSMLTGSTAHDAAVVETPVPNLDLLPTGAAIPALSETLERVPLVGHLRALRHGHRFVIIDAGQQALDILASICRGADGVIVVAERERSSMESIRVAVERFRSSGIEVMGTILAR